MISTVDDLTSGAQLALWDDLETTRVFAQAERLYSGALLASPAYKTGAPVKGLVEHAGKLWVCVGILSGGAGGTRHADLQRVVPRADWQGAVFAQPKQYLLCTPATIYTGRLVLYRGQEFVITGDSTTIHADRVQTTTP